MMRYYCLNEARYFDTLEEAVTEVKQSHVISYVDDSDNPYEIKGGE